jgi:hypothetical protein
VCLAHSNIFVALTPDANPEAKLMVAICTANVSLKQMSGAESNNIKLIVSFYLIPHSALLS